MQAHTHTHTHTLAHTQGCSARARVETPTSLLRTRTKHVVSENKNMWQHELESDGSIFLKVLACSIYNDSCKIWQEFERAKVEAVKKLEERFPSLIRLDLDAKSKSGWRRHSFIEQEPSSKGQEKAARGRPNTLIEQCYLSCVCLSSPKRAQ